MHDHEAVLMWGRGYLRLVAALVVIKVELGVEKVDGSGRKVVG